MKHYAILKQVICDIIDSYCTELMPYKSFLKPKCNECKEYSYFIFRKKICKKCNDVTCIRSSTEIENCEFYEN